MPLSAIANVLLTSKLILKKLETELQRYHNILSISGF